VIRARAFLAAYRATCNITRSAQLAGISPRRHYAWLERYPKYKAAFERANVVAASALEDRVKEGAFDGWIEQQSYQGKPMVDEEGKPVGIRRFDLGARQMLLRGAMPEKYGNKVQVSGADGGPIQSKLEVVFVKPHDSPVSGSVPVSL